MYRVCSSATQLLLGASFVANQRAFAQQAQAAHTTHQQYSRTNLKDKCVLITGATSGIGKSCAVRFASEGSRLVLIGRRENLLNDLKKELTTAYPNVRVHTVKLSVSDTDAVQQLPSKLPDNFKDVSVLINNAGCALGVATVENNSIADGVEMMETNVLGTIAMCKAFLPGMKERGEGHIINMGSIAGHVGYTTGSMYCASKFAVKGFSDAARHDLMGTPIRVTHISPGMVGNTEFSNVRFRAHGNDADSKASAVYADIVALHPDDIADNVFYAASAPPHVQIAELIVFATNQAGPRDIVRAGPSMGFNPPTTPSSSDKK